MNVYPRIASSILINCYQWEFCLPWKTPTKEPMELVVISNLLALDVLSQEKSGSIWEFHFRKSQDLDCLRYVSIFFTCLWYVSTAMLFRYKGRLVNSQQKYNFILCLRFIFAFRLVLCLSEKQSSTYIIPLYERIKSKYSAVL